MAKIIDGLVIKGQSYELAVTDTNLADIETDSGAASKAYAVGEHLILDGQYYVVTAPISKNDGLEEGTNIDVETVGNEIQVLQNRTDQLADDLKDNNVSFKFGFDGTNYGYYKDGADTVTPFKSQADIDAAVQQAINQTIQQYRCKYLGQFNGAKTINISGLGATSASQFLIVPVNSDTSGGMESSIYNNMYSYLRRGSVTAFSTTSITVSASTIQTRVTGNVDRSIYRNINYQVWYIPAHN